MAHELAVKKSEANDTETGDEGISESRISFLRGLDTVNLSKIQLISSCHIPH